ncbi:MAG: DUF4250 domain-containing protein [Rikenellaceae bacterium]
MIPQDPMILYSFINMKLRDEFASLSELCEVLDLREDEIIDKLESAGFEYNNEMNRFW